MHRNNLNRMDEDDDEQSDHCGELLKYLGESSECETAPESESGSDDETSSDSEDEDMNEALTQPPTTTPTASDWSNTVKTANVCAFKLQPGLKVTLQGKSPVDFFNLLFTKPLLEFLVKNVNDRASEYFSNREDSARAWKQVTMEEFYTFLGLLLHPGTINTWREEGYWIGDELFHFLELDKFYMSRDRWWLILKCLSFEDKTSGVKGRLSQASYMKNYFNNVMKNVIVPEKILCIDVSEHYQVNAIRVRTYLEQCMYPLLADRFGLVHNMQVHKGSADRKVKFDTDEVVKQLLEDRLDVGHSVYMEKDFTSVELTKFLVSRNTHVTGPLERDRAGNPSGVAVQLEKDQKITKYNSEGINVTKWRSKRFLLMLSTEHSGEWQEHVDKRNACIRAPVCAVEYKTNHTGIKKHEDMLYCYGRENVTRVWHKKVGIRILLMLLLNAHILHNRYGDKAMLWNHFHRVVIRHLLSRGEQSP